MASGNGVSCLSEIVPFSADQHYEGVQCNIIEVMRGGGQGGVQFQREKTLLNGTLLETVKLNAASIQSLDYSCAIYHRDHHFISIATIASTNACQPGNLVPPCTISSHQLAGVVHRIPYHLCARQIHCYISMVGVCLGLP